MYHIFESKKGQTIDDHQQYTHIA